jgi:hypothetical protein
MRIMAWDIAGDHTRHQEEREDLRNELLTHLWARRDSFKALSKFQTWACRVMKNRAITVTAKSKLPQGPITSATSLPALDEQLDLRMDLQRAIRLLAPKQQAIVLCDLIGSPPDTTGLSNPRQYRAMAYRNLRILLADGYDQSRQPGNLGSPGSPGSPGG